MRDISSAFKLQVYRLLGYVLFSILYVVCTCTLCLKKRLLVIFWITR